MSARLVLHLLVLALAAVVFVVLPEERVAGGSAPFDDGSYAEFGPGGPYDPEADLDDEALADGAADPFSWDGVGYSTPTDVAPAEHWPGIRGHVFDLSGQPVPGLTLQLAQVARSDGLEGTVRSLSAATEFDGSFAILVAEPSGDLTLADPDWVILAQWRRQLGAWHIESDVLVAPAVVVGGRVTSAARGVVPATVRASATYALPARASEVSGAEPGAEGSFARQCEVDDQGFFELGRVPVLPSTRVHARALENSDTADTAEAPERTIVLPDFGPGDLRIEID